MDAVLGSASGLSVIRTPLSPETTSTSPLALSKMMPSASGCAAIVPRTAFVLRSKITIAPLPSLMNPRPTSGTRATPWLCFLISPQSYVNEGPSLLTSFK